MSSDDATALGVFGENPLRIACVGGGQLGRMINLEAPRLGMSMSFLDPMGPTCPAGQTVPADRVVTGSLQDAAAIKTLAVGADVVTVEIEHVNVDALAELETAGVNVQPSSRVLKIIQDKYLQKEHFASSRDTHIPLPPFCATPSIAAIQQAAQKLGLPLMLKLRRGGYDGRGNAVLKSAEESSILEALVSLLGTLSRDQIAKLDGKFDIYAEGWVDFELEIAVMVVRSASTNSDGDNHTRCYPAVNAIQQDSICRVVLVPARHVATDLRHQAEQMAVAAIDSLGQGASGVFGVEMFITKSRSGENARVLLNEVAPRPHNTGHYTQDACATSQFENHLRGICGLPLGSTDLLVEAASMVNVLGAASGSMKDTVQSSQAALHMPNTVVHWYGKRECRSGRKMGHINLTGNSQAAVDQDLIQLLKLEGIPVSLLPGGGSGTDGGMEQSALVGVIMGSQSDLPTMNAAVEILNRFRIPYQVDIVSAHRTPDKLMSFSRSAADRGLRVIIAGAGGAAHLPGMVAAMTPLPVIGVPVHTETLSGVDSLYSIVQMPRGVPVATVAIGNAMNAGLLAVRILSTSRSELRDEMIKYQTEMKEMVDDMSSKLLDLGSDAFLEQMENKSKSVNV